MNRTYYSENWTEAQKAFLMENLRYIVIDSNRYGFNAYDFACINKLRCEKGIYLAFEGNHDDVYVSLAKSRHYWKIGEAGKSTYQDYENALEAELKAHDVTLEELQLLQRYSSLEYYSSVEDWEIQKNKKLVMHLKDSYSTDTIIDFLLYLEDGKQRENLKDAHDVLEADGGNPRFCRGETFNAGSFKCKGYLNGKAEITMLSGAEFSADFLERLNSFIAISEKAHKKSIWCTWTY